MAKIRKIARDVKNAFVDIDAALTKGKYGFECECKCDNVELIAYVNETTKFWGLDDDIHFCPLYFDDVEAVRASIMAHEFSHFFLGTKDDYKSSHIVVNSNIDLQTDIEYGQFFELAYDTGRTQESIDRQFRLWLRNTLQK